MTGLAGPDTAHLKRWTDQNALKALSEALLTADNAVRGPELDSPTHHHHLMCW